MSANTYDIGDTVRVFVEWTDTDGVLIDPTALTFKLQRPGGVSVETYVYPAALGLIRDSAGKFHFDVPVMDSGGHYYRWESAGPIGKGAVENYFKVRESYFE
jgi:hypothetical protein